MERGLKICVKAGDISVESLFSSTVGISSGPFALCSLRLDSKLITPSFCMDLSHRILQF